MKLSSRRRVPKLWDRDNLRDSQARRKDAIVYAAEEMTSDSQVRDYHISRFPEFDLRLPFLTSQNADSCVSQWFLNCFPHPGTGQALRIQKPLHARIGIQMVVLVLEDIDTMFHDFGRELGIIEEIL